MTAMEIVSEYHDGIVVLDDVDNGYMSRFWLVPTKETELEVWWASQESFGDISDGLSAEDLAAWCKVFNEEPPSPTPIRNKVVWPGEFITASTDEEFVYWLQLANDGQHYICNRCCDYDSYLKRADGTILRHKGYVGAKA